MGLTNRHYIEKGGFAYLNSSLNFQIESEMQRDMQATAHAVGESQLNELYELWNYFIRQSRPKVPMRLRKLIFSEP